MATADAPPRARWWRTALLIASIPPLVGIVIGCTGGWWWPGELCSHWTLHGAVALLPAAILWRRARPWGPLLMLVIVLGVAPWFAAAWESRAPAPADSHSRVRVLHANIHRDNPHAARDLPVIATSDAAIVSLIEVAEDDRASLRDDPRWPHQRWEILPPLRGGGPPASVALLSAHPIAWSTATVVDREPIIEAELIIADRRLRVVVCHPKSPMTPSRLRSRQRQFATVAAIAAGAALPVVALGDFNCTVGSPEWRAFREVSGLRRSARPGTATWPAVLGPFGIGIDHILVGGGAGLAEVESRWIADSDHLALEATVGF